MIDIPLRISFRHMEPSEAVQQRVREKVEKLQQFNKRLQSCDVVIEAPHQHHNKGKVYHIRLALAVPGSPEIVVSKESEADPAHEDIYIAIRDAFDAARRQLKRLDKKKKK